LVAAAVLVEARPLLAARDYAALRTYAGSAPVTRQSGTRRVVVMRRACSGRLRQALYYWAAGSLRRDPRSEAHYRAARQRGQSHGRALRGLADRQLRILMALLRTRRPYDPAHATRAA
jgi:transposase